MLSSNPLLPHLKVEQFTANHVVFMHKIFCINPNILYVIVADEEMIVLIFNFVINPKWLM